MPTPGAIRVGVFVQQESGEIMEAMEEANLDLAQLHGSQGPRTAEILGPEKVLRVFWPERESDPEAFEAALSEWRDLAKMFLFDAGFAGGGHGKKIKFLPSVVSPRPYLLAGGLRLSDVKALWPSTDKELLGFDLNSGLESAPGVKDLEAMKAFFRSLAAGARAVGPFQAGEPVQR
jgi:phosphoribosylanthranilate isomerase